LPLDWVNKPETHVKSTQNVMRTIAQAVALTAVLAVNEAVAQMAGSRPMTRRDSVQAGLVPMTRLDSLRMAYAIQIPELNRITVPTNVLAPGSSMGSPSAYGASAGVVYAGAGYQERTRFTRIADGAVFVGAGVGDPVGLGALEVTLTSFSTLRSPVGETGGVSFKYHRVITGALRAAVGVENALSWGGTDGGRSTYAALTTAFQVHSNTDRPFSVVSVNVGAGNGRFRSESDVTADRSGIAPFAGVGVGVTRSLAAAADWTGADLTAGLIFSPRALPGLSVSAGIADLTGSAGDGRRFVAGIGYGFNTKRDSRRATPEDIR
jgi:hypothetical protein